MTKLPKADYEKLTAPWKPPAGLPKPWLTLMEEAGNDDDKAAVAALREKMAKGDFMPTLTLGLPRRR